MTRRPASGVWMPARIFPSVLLPAPFSPHNAWQDPAAISSDTSVSACTPGNRRVMFSKRTAGSVMRRLRLRRLHLEVRVRHVGEPPRLELARPRTEVVLRDAYELHGDDRRHILLVDQLIDDG